LTYRANRELSLAATKPFQLRLPKDLRKLVEEAANESGRSLNAELVHLVGRALSATNGKAGGDISEPSPSRYSGRPPEERLIDAFRLLSPEAQLGLLTLLSALKSG
jgi:hypothetical protein